VAKKSSRASKKLKSSKIKSFQKSESIATLHLNQEIWPIERDVFFRPGRMKYVRKLLVPKGCVFCTSAVNKESLKTLCVYKTKYSQVIVNKFPYNNGHILVLPLRHTGDLLELSQDEFTDLHETLKLSVKVIKSIYNPHGFNIGLNHGSSGGAGIPDHLHYHIVPRWNGDLNFFPLIAETKLVIETVDQTYKKLKKSFQEIV